MSRLAEKNFIKRFVVDVFIPIIFSTLLFARCADFAPTRRDRSSSTAPVPPAFAVEFMRKYGYLDAGLSGAEAQYTDESMSETIRNVQKFGNIPRTGVFDNATLELMRASRCGVPDVDRRPRSRNKRYIVASVGWKKRLITYYVANWSPQLGEAAVVEQTMRAFEVWSPYSRLKFKQVNDPNADIIVGFGRGEHGDGYAFDGPGNVLAHAFFPYEMGAYGGDLHFDDDERWKTRSTAEDTVEGTDYHSVAVHEIGHSLGLGHSPVPTSVMFPYYKGPTSDLQLGYDDILGVYQLYITRQLEGDNATSEEPAVTSEEPEVTTQIWENDIPNGTTLTTEMYTPTTEENYVVTFEGDYETVEEYLRREAERKRNTTTTTRSEPLSTKSTVPDICQGNFDAISVFREELFVFKGEYLWRMARRAVIENDYPVKFHQLFRDLPSHVTRVDAAYERHTDGYIVLFSGKRYWVYDGTSFVEGSPRPLTDYGISEDVEKIDAVQIWPKNDKVYLYSGAQFWRFNESSRSLDSGYPDRMKRWRGVPTHIDAAMTWIDGKTYFFKGKLFWRFDNFLIKTESRYPRDAPRYWLGCPE